MKRTMLATIALLGVGLSVPALAAKMDDGGLDKAVAVPLVVTRVGGLGCGLVMGIPTAAVRESLKATKSITLSLADRIGGRACGPSVLLVSPVSVPAGIAVGGVKGVYYGAKNGFKHGFTEPFSEESMSANDKFDE